ncbi:tyrosine-protein kinase transforming protein SEA [Capsaspora owczarzaki ATCC 30864]|uniref:tyrosine-protein kinase transforming protein SEA n=1 Tax=Capsaspora owczarzaki (strain ATCC 30864) TaxID=595528 RepID=UPI0003527042|nr:tyrosine-protein kinase transforming protein SEA [Capsaspora owczarzaki ATCC 30864]|eukprot:XP_004343688.2 tyrosine-protein kinase transforming protein SEA [Capsaspora owczarzaki ATCC 30864]
MAAQYRATCTAYLKGMKVPGGCGSGDGTCDTLCSSSAQFAGASTVSKSLGEIDDNATPNWNTYYYNNVVVNTFGGQIVWWFDCEDYDPWNANDDMGSRTFTVPMNTNADYGSVSSSTWYDLGGTASGTFPVQNIYVAFRANCDANYYNSTCAEFCQVGNPPACTACNAVSGNCTCSVGYTGKDCESCVGSNYWPVGTSGQTDFQCVYCANTSLPTACYTCGTGGVKSCCGGWTGPNCDISNVCGAFPMPPLNSIAVMNATSCNCNTTGCMCTYACKSGFSGGSATTTCPSSGPWGWSSTLTCTDRDECAPGGGNQCNQICNNTIGDYTCACNSGYSINNAGRGPSGCTDLDECSTNNGNCGQNCNNVPGSYHCSCYDGFRLQGDGKSCSEIDECQEGLDNCDGNATCTNTIGSFECACYAGFVGNGTVCTDVDECATLPCSEFADCANFPGNFTCTCQIGYAGNGVQCVFGNSAAFAESSRFVLLSDGVEMLPEFDGILVLFNVSSLDLILGVDYTVETPSPLDSVSAFNKSTIAVDANDNPNAVVRFSAASRAFRVDITAGTYPLTIERYSYASLVNAINVTVWCDFPVPQNISIVIPANQVAATKVIQLPFSSVPTLDVEHTYTIVDATVTGSGSAAAIGYYSTSRVTVNAHDDPYGVFGFSLTQMSVAESSTGFVQLKRLKGTLGTTVVRVRTLTLSSSQTNGVGIASPSDYAAVSQLVTFSENDVEAQVSIAVLADGVPELDEMFGLLLEYVSGPGRVDATLALALVTIPENDNARGVLSITRASSCFEELPLVGGVPQLNNTVAIEVIRSGGLYGAISFTWSMHSGRFKNTTLSADNRASAPEDYTASSSQTVTIAAGVDRAQIEVMLLADSIPELDEYFWVQLDSASYGVTIDPISNFTDVCIGMNDNPFGSLAFERVSLTPSATGESRLLVRESDVSARTITFEPGQSTALASWTISADSAQEPTELFKLVLTANGASAGQEATFLVGATSLDSTIPCAIEAQDGVTGVLSFVQPTISVVEDAGKVTLTVQRVGGSATEVSFQTNAVPLSASGDDFDASNQNNMHIMAPSQTSVSFDIEVSKDSASELDETFTVTLVNVTGATLSWMSVATVTILRNDDVNGVVEFAPSSGQNPLVTTVSEDSGLIRLPLWREISQVGVVTLSFVVTTDLSSDPVCASLSGLGLSSAPANLTRDVDAAPFVLTFGDGQNEAELAILLHDNSLLDGSRVMFICLKDLQGGARFGASQAMAIVIQDDEHDTNESSSAPVAAAAAGAAAGGVVVILIVLLVVGLRRRRGRSNFSGASKGKQLSGASDPTYEAVSRNQMYDNNLRVPDETYQPVLQTVVQEDPYESLPQPTAPDESLFNTVNPACEKVTEDNPDFDAMRASFRPSVPVDNYEDLYIASVTAFQQHQRFSRHELKLSTQLGSGNFGEVWLAHVPSRWLEKKSRQSLSVSATTVATVAVAVKTLKAGASDKSKSDFASEAQIMRRFNHSSIVSVVEVFVEEEPWMLVLELLPYGDLHKCIESCHARGLTPTTGEYLHMFSQVASGLSYLAGLRFVHRDIAARNCLVGADLVVKISDFGLSRELEEQNYYRMQTRGALPVRWMAPEFLLFRKSSPASDVWAFGVLMWEVMSAGVLPYKGVDSKAIVQFLESGQRLSRPPLCNDKLWALVSSCWTWEVTDRVDAAQLYAAFTGMAFDNPELDSVRDLGALLAGTSSFI